MGGYHFITGGGYQYSSHMTEETLQYMMTEIDAAREADTTKSKPVFLVTHHPIHETVKGSNAEVDTRYSVEFKKFLNERPWVIALTAHVHTPSQNPLSIWQDGFTVFHSSVTAGGYMGSDGNRNDLVPEYAVSTGTELHGRSQAAMIDITTDNIVKIYKLDLNADEFIGEPWIIDISDGAEGFRYTAEKREAEKVTTAFPTGAAVTVTSIDNEKVNINFSKAECTELGAQQDGYVSAYRVEAVNKETGAVDFNETYVSDYFLSETLRKDSFDCAVTSLEGGATYTINVYPQTPLGVEGTPISVEATAADGTILTESELAKTVPTADILDIEFVDDNINDNSPRAVEAEVLGEPVMTEISNGYKYASFDGVDDAYRYNISSIYDSCTQTISIETMFRIPDGTYASNTSYSIFSGAESGGLGMYYKNGEVCVDVYINGNYSTVSSPINTGKWVHAIASYDGGTLRLFVDGVAVDEVKATGNIGWIPNFVVNGTKAMILGADTTWDAGDKNGDGQTEPTLQAFGKVDILNARLYSSPMTVGPVNKLYKETINVLYNTPDTITVSAIDFTDKGENVTVDGSNVTVPAGESVTYSIGVGDGKTYNATLTATTTSKVSVSVNGNVKVYNKSFTSGTSFDWVNLATGTNTVTITNTGTSAMVISALNLAKRSYSSSTKWIALPAMNHNSGGNGIGYYTAGAESMSFNTDYTRLILADGQWVTYDLDMAAAGEFYVLSYGGLNNVSAPRYALAVNGVKVIDTTLENSITNNEKQFATLGKITLNAGKNTLKFINYQPNEWAGLALAKSSTAATIGETGGTINASTNRSAWRWNDATELNGGESRFFTTAYNPNYIWNFGNGKAVAYVFEVTKAGIYDVGIYGGCKSTDAMSDIHIDGMKLIKQMNGTSSSWAAPNDRFHTLCLELSEGTHTLTYIPGASCQFYSIQFTKQDVQAKLCSGATEVESFTDGGTYTVTAALPENTNSQVITALYDSDEGRLVDVLDYSTGKGAFASSEFTVSGGDEIKILIWNMDDISPKGNNVQISKAQ